MTWRIIWQNLQFYLRIFILLSIFSYLFLTWHSRRKSNFFSTELKWMNTWIRDIKLCFFDHQRFLPSEFGLDVERHNAVEPVTSFLEKKVKIRRAIEAEGIPYTYISSNAFAGYFLPNLLHQNVTAPPRDKVVIPGD